MQALSLEKVNPRHLELNEKGEMKWKSILIRNSECI